ncbi:MAG: histidine kinase, partial [Acidimicrobiia bacterium]|nr:histidine kinase [Acidimicrobiia bacterium]
LNERKSELISELRATQRELVDAERTKGVLAERTRMAAEIHDTLAQGFTSIVLLSRAGIRSGDATQALKSIEETAQENLADARRLIEAIRPPELGAGSLPMALERQLDSVLPDEVDRHFAVEGEPRALNGAVEVTVLRAAQEALLNIRTHARADRVDMVLRFSEESVTLDVRDNGVGFTAGEVADRGDLTGGQGLALLRRRAESLSGRLDLGPGGSNGTSRGAGRGSHVSLTLPVIGS